MKYRVESTGPKVHTGPLLESLKRLFREWGIDEAALDDAPEVVVYCHNFREIHIRARDLALCPFGASARLVVLVRPLTLRTIARGGPDTAQSRDGTLRVIALDPVPGAYRALAGAITELGVSATKRGACSPKAWSLDTLRALGSATLGIEWDAKSVADVVRQVVEGKGVQPSDEIVGVVTVGLTGQNNSVAEDALLKALLLLTSDESASRHAARAKMDRPFEGGASGITDPTPDLGRQWRSRRFLEFCTDLRAWLTVPERKYAGGTILVLDDHPGSDFERVWQAVAGEISSSYTPAIEVINPFDIQGKGTYDDGAFYFLTEYQTLHSLKPSERIKKDVEALARKIGHAHFILVDQLFRLKPRGRDDFLGPKLIRGLIRWMRDVGREGLGRTEGLPEVLAISRTDDPAVIQAALRAGAKDYVLKSRFTALPAVLDRVRRGSSESTASLHRNFRVLYDLPSETIGLLRSARIPQISFHDRSDEDSRGSAPEWAQLLASMPKTDLHVHAGSVMSREFLVLASFIMLLRHRWDDKAAETGPVGAVVPSGLRKTGPIGTQVTALVKLCHEILDSSGAAVAVTPRDGALGSQEPLALSLAGTGPSPVGRDWVEAWGQIAKGELKRRLTGPALDANQCREFRAHLHRDLGVRDYLGGEAAAQAVSKKNDLDIALYLLRHADSVAIGSKSFAIDLGAWKNEDLIRAYILVLASRYPAKGTGEPRIEIRGPANPLLLFRKESDATEASKAVRAWAGLRKRFFSEKRKSRLGYEGFRARGWSWAPAWRQMGGEPPLRVVLPFSPKASECRKPLDFAEDPIGYTLATGTRSKNLAEYLLGCEFSGAEHLRHPFLIHVYAAQVLLDWVRQGVFYAELKTSPDGFVQPESGFEHGSVVQCLVQAFSEEQAEVLAVYRAACSNEELGNRKSWPGCVLGSRYEFSQLRSAFAAVGDALAGEEENEQERKAPPDPRDAVRLRLPSPPSRLPCKASLIFVGKRHKSLREMILEAAGAAVMRPAGESPADSARDFVLREFTRCRVVGFDLAGQEDGYPPSEYADEFGRLTRLHVPITVHAGENAPPQFIEDAILELGAIRIGHGLSLAEDRKLLARVRDERISVELCPVCNHQTSQFHSPHEDAKPGRRYPLADFLQSGLLVSVNTDNPIISDTDMVREFFQASWAYGKNGLPLWEALRIIRMGFVSSFLNLQERKNLLELVGQYLYDLFNDKKMVMKLRRLVEAQSPAS